MPDTIDYDATKMRLLIGTGFVEKVEQAVGSPSISSTATVPRIADPVTRRCASLH